MARRTYVLDRGFQLKYTLLLVGVGVLISTLFGTMMYLTHVDSLRVLAETGDAEAAARGSTTIIWLLVAITVLMAAALSLVGILITHRVAGPVYVMSHYVSVLSNGRYPIMRKLRKSDELREFFEGFSEAIESMRQREAKEADTLREVVQKLGGLAQDDETAKGLLAELQSMHDRKRDATDRVDIGKRD